MTIGLFMSLAGNVLAVIAILVLATGRSLARELAFDRAVEAAELKHDVKALERTCEAYRAAVHEQDAELAGHRARAEQVRLGALRASQASAAARKAKAH